MAPRTRRKQPIKEEAYTSTPSLKQKRFSSRRKSIRAPNSTSRESDKRQSTLTQIDFARLQHYDGVNDSEDDGEEEDEEDREVQRPKKRRKSSGQRSEGEQTKATKQSTLTQIGFIPRGRWSVEDSDDEEPLSEDDESGHQREENGCMPQADEFVPQNDDNDEKMAPLGTHTELRGFVGDKERESPLDSDGLNTGAVRTSPCPVRNPRTPKRVRVLAVPSSQTPPISPLSTQQTPRRPGSSHERSPLQERSTNALVVGDSNTLLTRESPKESPTKRRVREFNARYALLSRAESAKGNMNRTRPGIGIPPRIIRSNTGWSSVRDEENDSVDQASKLNAETQFGIGEETQAIFGAIDLACEAPGSSDSSSAVSEVQREISPATLPDKTSNAMNEVTSCEDSAMEGHSSAGRERVYMEQPSPEPQVAFSDDERVPSSQNYEIRQSNSRTGSIELLESSPHRNISFDDEMLVTYPGETQYTGPARRVVSLHSSLAGQAPQPTAMTEGIQDIASEQALGETHTHTMSIPSTPRAADESISEQTPRAIFRQPPIPSSRETVRPSQATTVDETPTSPAMHTQQQLPTSPGKPQTQMPSYSLEAGVQVPVTPSRRNMVQVPSSPIPMPPGLLMDLRSSPSSKSSNPKTPNALRFLKGPLTVSQLIPESLRDQSIPLPPPWTQDEDDEDDEL